jgi:hypothetical protein
MTFVTLPSAHPTTRAGRMPFFLIGFTFLFFACELPSTSEILPTLTVDRSHVHFAANLDPEELIITNSGEGALRWRIEGEPDWLVVDPTSGEVAKGSDVVTLRVDPTEATATTLQDTIIVTSDIGGNVKVAVTAEVSQVSSSLTVVTTELNLGFIDELGEITLRNTGEVSVPYLAKPDSSWIEILEQDQQGEVPPNGKRDITFRVNRKNLSPGNHKGSVTITTDDIVKAVIIRVNVEAQPKIALSDLDEGTLEIGYHDGVSFRVTNEGTGTLAWYAEERETSGDLDWLRFDRSYLDELIQGGDEPIKVNVTVDRQGLKAGPYRGEIVIKSNDFREDYGRLTIPVSMTVPVPEVEILLGPKEGDTVTNNTLEFTLRAFNAYGDIEFSTRLDNHPWTDWTSDSFVVYTDLEESSLLGVPSLFSAKTRTLAGESAVKEREFYIDAIVGPAIRFSPEHSTGQVDVETIVDVILEEVDTILGVHLILEFDPDFIAFEGWERGAFLAQHGAEITELEGPANEEGRVSVSLVALGGDVAGVSGTGRLLRCHILPLQPGTTSIRIGPESRLRDIDNNDIQEFKRRPAEISID